jgi:hypothetical protein
MGQRRLRVRPYLNWNRVPGFAWICQPCPEHRRRIIGFTKIKTWSQPDRTPEQARAAAMDGARLHIHRYHQGTP